MRPVYLDNHSTTPCDPRVVAAMLPYFTERFGNPSSAHVYGDEAEQAVERAREVVSTLIGTRPRDIVFTSGATEANNLAILGLAGTYAGLRRRIVTTAVEHKAVLEPARALATRGFEVVVLPVTSQGRVDLVAATEAITDDTLLVSVQTANNELGVIQPVAEVAALAHARGAVFHTDAAQVVGKVPVDVRSWDADMLSLSAHKFYGPKGVGALFVRGGASTRQLAPIGLGGGQERGLRPGTHNVPGIVGMGEAARIALEEMNSEAERLSGLRDRFEAMLEVALPVLRVNGRAAPRLPGSSSFTVPGIEADALLANLPGLSLSTGSACTAGAVEPSHVLTAIGLSRADAHATLRVGIGRFNTAAELEAASTTIAEAGARLLQWPASER